jgi:tRNA dimethylallyltransferase
MIGKTLKSPQNNSFNTVLVLLGPTGVGKTALSKAIAEKVLLEIVSADSRQIYRYMDIGTAKPSLALQKQIPHHFIDILEPDENYSAGQYMKTARRVIEEIIQRKKLPLVVGGSGLYIRALIEGFFQEDIKDSQLREKLQTRLKREGSGALYDELNRVDPAAAKEIHPNNTRRMIRALEVFYTAGIPISEIQEKNPDPAPFRAIKIGLAMERKKLYAKINQRVEMMFEEGLVEEVRRILNMGYSPEINALNSVGYREAIAYLRGDIDLFTCKELVKQNTRRYAKRQFTWFRKEQDITWMEISGNEDIPGAVKQIMDIVEINKLYFEGA